MTTEHVNNIEVCKASVFSYDKRCNDFRLNIVCGDRFTERAINGAFYDPYTIEEELQKLGSVLLSGFCVNCPNNDNSPDQPSSRVS